MRTKYHFTYLYLLAFCFALLPLAGISQSKELLQATDSSGTAAVAKIDSITKPAKPLAVHSPRKAAIRSAILPGLGQIYNKKYWKLPIVYGALGVTGYIFVDNVKTYKEYRHAYGVRFRYGQPTATSADTADYNALLPLYRIVGVEALRTSRDRFRQYIDYSVLFFVLFWGLNVVDATVDAHLKGFDVSPDLSIYIKPGRSEMAGTNGLSLVMPLGQKKHSPLLTARF
jgi:Family of unknown function (DUF5683)